MHDNPKDRGGSRTSPSLALRLDGYFLHLNLPVFDYNYYFNLHCIKFFGLFILLSRASVSLCDHSPIALQIYKIHLKVQIIFQVFSKGKTLFFCLFMRKKMKGRKSLFSPPPSFFLYFSILDYGFFDFGIIHGCRRATMLFSFQYHISPIYTLTFRNSLKYSVI